MTRPRMDGSARNCKVALAVAMKAMEAAPMGKISQGGGQIGRQGHGHDEERRRPCRWR